MPPPPTAPAEMTVKAVALGIFLAFVFGSANAYLGMRAGQTVAATIPAAVIAMALFRLPWCKGTLLEQNIARTGASVGEALVAGAIFTIPAFTMIEMDGARLWTGLRDHYWEATLIMLTGGLIGVFFIILLRRPLCVDAGLPWPESVASVEIMKAGEAKGGPSRYIFGAMGFAAILQVLKSNRGLQIFREYSEGFFAFPPSVVRHFNFDKHPIGEVAHGGGIPWATPALSPALMGIGYIIGPELASINVAGGILAWWVMIPLLLFFDPDLGRRLGGGDNAAPDLLAYTLWYNVVRPIAVGAMLVAACNTLLGMRHSITKSLKGAFVATGAATEEHAQNGAAVRGSNPGVSGPFGGADDALCATEDHAQDGAWARQGRAAQDRTEQDIPARWVLAATLVLLIPITAIYYHFTGDWTTAALAAVVMTVAGFLLSVVGGYLVGLVGSSNQPLSGLTLAALVIAALLMVVAGATGKAGMAAVLGVAAVVCCACSVSGSLIQDLKAGHLLGGTPWKMQVVEIATVILLSFFLLAPIIALHEANLDTGGIGGRALPAPQAGLMAQLTQGIVGGKMAWGLLGIGAAFGVALILCGARAPMLIAVGMYLPFDTTSAIFLGGVIKWLLDRRMAHRTEADKQSAEERGTLLASGLIAGEAIMGILLAVALVAGLPSLSHLLLGVEVMPFYAAWGGWLSLAGFAALTWMLLHLPSRRA